MGYEAYRKTGLGGSVEILVVNRSVGHAEAGPAHVKANNSAPVRVMEGGMESTLQSLGPLFTLANGNLETKGAVKPSMSLGSPLTVLENRFPLTFFFFFSEL